MKFTHPYRGMRGLGDYGSSDLDTADMAGGLIPAGDAGAATPLYAGSQNPILTSSGAVIPSVATDATAAGTLALESGIPAATTIGQSASGSLSTLLNSLLGKPSPGAATVGFAFPPILIIGGIALLLVGAKRK